MSLYELFAAHSITSSLSSGRTTNPSFQTHSWPTGASSGRSSSAHGAGASLGSVVRGFNDSSWSTYRYSLLATGGCPTARSYSRCSSVPGSGSSDGWTAFVEKAFSCIDLDPSDYVETSSRYYRPNEVEYLLGDSSKAQELLGWKPKHSFEQLVEMMVINDIEEAKKEQVLLSQGLIEPTWEHPILN